MIVHQIYTKSSLRNFTYIVASAKGRGAYCIDPYYPKQILSFLNENNYNLLGVINTHEHSDHTRGNEELKAKTACEVYALEGLEEFVPGLTKTLKEGDKLFPDSNNQISLKAIEAGEYLQVFETPGHTMKHLCLGLHKESRLEGIFTGDTLFNAGVGNCGNGGDPETLYQTICDVFSPLGDEVLIYPGHEYWENNLRFTKSLCPKNAEVDKILREGSFKDGDQFLISTLGLERQVSAFFSLQNKELISSLKEKGLPATDEKSRFLSLRELRNNW